jgi:hypothetical protein
MKKNSFVTDAHTFESYNPDSPRIRHLIANHYDIIDFPQDPANLGHEDNFGYLSIYVRRPENFYAS